MDEYPIFTKEALKDQDGKKVPLTKYPGGPVIGECTLKYNEAEKRLDLVEASITDEAYLKLLSNPSVPISKKER
jgi:hypothetical protein